MVAGPSDESFLPQIVGVFYAVFDPHRGPIVPYQVPETLISQPEDLNKSIHAHSHGQPNRSDRRPSPTPPSGTPARSHSSSPTRAPSTISKRALSVSPSRTFRSNSRRSPSPLAQSTSSIMPYNPQPLISPAMIDFTSIAEYIIPKSPLKHRLITCCSGRYKIIGFPCLIEDTSYERNEFIFNIGFVFDRLSDLSAFEPVVRKCGRIMRAAELDTRWLSTKTAQPKIQSVLEQLHEDLNSYSATSIVLDGINSLDLTLFPFYANPPPVHDWHVPVALIDFQKLKDANWDITASKICQYIDGVQHVERIAQLADADLDSVRSCIQHFLYYQVVMMIDIFQYSNMYTCKPAIQRKIKDRGVSEECGLYVTQPGFPIPSWPVLAILYSQLRPGITVHEWMEANQVGQRGIDVRRFVTFGIIKGFLRRVHRWPIYVDTVTGANAGALGKDPLRPRSKERARIGDIDEESPGRHEPGVGSSSGSRGETLGKLTSGLGMLRMGEETKRKDSMATASGTVGGSTSGGLGGGTSTAGRNESSITLRTTTTTTSTTGSMGTSPNTGGGIWRARSDSPTPGAYMQVTPTPIAMGHDHHHINNPPGNRQSKSPGYFQSQAPMLSSSLRSNQGIGIISTSHTTNQSVPRGTGGGGGGSQNSLQTGFLGPGGRPLGHHRNSRDARTRGGGLRTPGGAGPNHAAITQQEQDTHLHASMLGYLDGLHHADELQVKFKMGWNKLEECLKSIAGLPVGVGGDLPGLSDERKESIARGDFGKIVIVLR